MPTIEKAANLTDALDRLTGKSYPDGSGMTDVLYTYDDADAFGLGRRTGMIDASGSSNWVYDARGRLVEESRTILGGYYVTGFTYDAAGRLTTVQYPTGETVTQTYSDRGLPYSLSGNETGTLVSSALYNQLGAITQINLGNGVTTEFDYWGLDHGSDHYGMLYEIKTYKGETTHQQVQHTWDDAGNLVTRYDAVDEETESFTYDFLDRLTAASGAYSRSYSYDAIGNIVSRNSVSYTYGSSRPHAVTQFGNTTYDYDANGNMVLRGDQTISWNADNMPAAIAGLDDLTTFVYDGDGGRVIKTENGETTVYVNSYYELDLTTGNATAYYYLGARLVAFKAGANLRFVHQDHLTGTSLTTDASGALVARVKYYPYGETRSSSGALGTDRMFTGQRLDGTGLYFYNARYYDPLLGRFISPDTLVPNYINPQSFNRYSYCLNNPLRYVDPTGYGNEPPDVQFDDIPGWDYIWVPCVDNPDGWIPHWFPTENQASGTAGSVSEWPWGGSLVYDEEGVPVWTPIPKWALMEGWWESSFYAQDGYVLDVYANEYCHYSYAFVWSDWITVSNLQWWHTAFQFNYCPGIEYLNDPIMTLEVGFQTPGYINCNWAARNSYGLAAGLLKRRPFQDVLSAIYGDMKNAGALEETRITMYDNVGQQVGQWGGEGNWMPGAREMTKYALVELAKETGKMLLDRGLTWAITHIP